MPIPVMCPCGAKLRVKDELRGKQIKCPQCGAICTVGAPPGAAAPAKSATDNAAAPPDRARIIADSGFSPKEIARLEKELHKDESLLWAAKPDLGRPTQVGCGVAAILLFPAAILVGANFMMKAPEGDNVVGQIIHNAPMVIGGILVLVAFLFPFLLRRRYKHTCYVLTGKRALAWDGRMLGGTRFQDYDPADLAHMGRQDFSFGAASGIGHLTFATEVKHTTKGSYVARYNGFFYIRHFAEVEKLIRKHLLESYLEKLYE